MTPEEVTAAIAAAIKPLEERVAKLERVLWGEHPPDDADAQPTEPAS
jgi:hypothetical protein